MSGKDRFVVLMAVVVSIGSLVGAASLMPRINRSRAELQLVANEDVTKNLPAGIAFLHAAFGSARGLVVDMLWARTTKLKEEGKFYEAMQLADWITKLQPRFPQVWSFHGWNMAYNVSVATHTPQERWMWVQAGLKLLRDEGIPLNPNSVLLYKELAWIHLHKIGKYSDDMHWYYKRQFAQEWQGVLGAPPQGRAEEVVAWFGPVAEAYERYVNDREPDRATRTELERLIGINVKYERMLSELRPLSLQLLDIRLGAVMRTADEDVRQELQTLRGLVTRQVAAAGVDPVERLVRARPGVRPLIARLRAMGHRELDAELLGRLMAVRGRAESRDVKLLGLAPSAEAAAADKPLADFLADPAIAGEREVLLAFLKARVLQDRYHMNPIWMQELMEGKLFASLAKLEARLGTTQMVNIRPEGELVPLDWRHPSAHGLYWTSLGVRKSRGLLRPEDFDVLNTDRQIMMAMQDLTINGKIIFDPVSGYYRQLAEPAFIPAYEVALYGAQERLTTRQKTETAAPESFEAAHENFLVDAVQMAYFNGREDIAESYYEKLRRLYGRKGESRPLRFARPLEDFVRGELDRDDSWDSPEQMTFVVTGLIAQAIDQGWANGRLDSANRYLRASKGIYDNYMKKRGEATRHAERGRMALPPFEELTADVLAGYLVQPLSPSVSMLAKVRVWSNAPDAIKARVFELVREPLYTQASRVGLNAAAAFAPPAGLEAVRRDGAGSITPQAPAPSGGKAPPGAGPLKSQDIVR